MCVDCVLASPRIAQVDPDDGPPLQVVLSHLTPSRCSCGKDARMWDLGPWMRDHGQRHAKIRGSGSKCGMCLAYGRLDWYSAGPQDLRMRNSLDALSHPMPAGSLSFNQNQAIL
jgi:hypothetical protein